MSLRPALSKGRWYGVVGLFKALSAGLILVPLETWVKIPLISMEAEIGQQLLEKFPLHGG